MAQGSMDPIATQLAYPSGDDLLMHGKTTATSTKLRPSLTARMARRYLTWRQLPCCWAVFRLRSTAIQEYVMRV
jgi:hypothetical protein